MKKLGVGQRLSLRRKPGKASLSASGGRAKEGGLLIQEEGNTGHREGKGGTVRHRSLPREGGCWKGILFVFFFIDSTFS